MTHKYEIQYSITPKHNSDTVDVTVALYKVSEELEYVEGLVATCHKDDADKIVHRESARLGNRVVNLLDK